MTGVEADDAERVRAAVQAKRQRVKASSGALVLVNESAEHVDSADVRRRGRRSNGGQRTGWIGWMKIERTVRPHTVVLLQILGQHLAQLVLVPDQRPVQAPVADGAYPPSA